MCTHTHRHTDTYTSNVYIVELRWLTWLLLRSACNDNDLILSIFHYRSYNVYVHAHIHAHAHARTRTYTQILESIEYCSEQTIA